MLCQVDVYKQRLFICSTIILQEEAEDLLVHEEAERVVVVNDQGVEDKRVGEVSSSFHVIQKILANESFFDVNSLNSAFVHPNLTFRAL